MIDAVDAVNELELIEVTIFYEEDRTLMLIFLETRNLRDDENPFTRLNLKDVPGCVGWGITISYYLSSDESPEYGSYIVADVHGDECRYTRLKLNMQPDVWNVIASKISERSGFRIPDISGGSHGTLN